MRILLLLGTNIAIMAVLTISMRLLGLEPYLNANGINYTSLLFMSGIFGFGGAFISLLMSKWMAKRSVGAQVIETPRNDTEQWLLQTVNLQAQQLGIQPPELAIWNSSTMNAFATGANKNKALVAVSTGLLNGMTKTEVEAVIGHEMAHVANGDMVTLTLIQGVVNTFVIFLSRIIGDFVDRVILKSQRSGGIGYFIASMAAQIVLGILASMIVCWFSRRREFKADEGGAKLVGPDAMAAALRRLANQQTEPLPDKMAAFGISGSVANGLKRLYMTHPPIEERIAALEKGTRGTV